MFGTKLALILMFFRPERMTGNPVQNQQMLTLNTQIAIDDRAGQAAPTPPTSLLWVGAHEVRLFESSQELLAAMVQDIRAAKTRVWLETYTILADRAGAAIADALKDRARAGLDVRLLYDAMGSCTTPGRFFRELSEAGVRVHCYHSLTEALGRFTFVSVLNRRDHRKMLIVDDHSAFFGGMNIVDQSGITTVAEARAAHLPASAGWRDVHLRLCGPKQQEVAAAFERVWRSAAEGQRVRLPRWPLREMLQGAEGDLFFFESWPGLRGRRPARVFVPLIRRARRSITLSMAYFIPIGRVLRELYRAARRGVRVRVIIPGQSDVRLVQWATRHMLSGLLRRGIVVYERQDQMLHSKVMVVDDRWTVVGSCNLDPRSLRLNLEFIGVCCSQEMAAAVKQICLADMRSSRRVRLRDCCRRRWWQCMLDRAAWSVRGLL